MNVEELAEKAYKTWDTYGGRGLGHWGAPYVLEAWTEVVNEIRSAALEEAVEALDEEAEELIEKSDREAFAHAADVLQRLAPTGEAN